ncbi:MAG: hypothetical protein J7515_12300 [Caulobacter sp.]|nr:hypothetical protein [Caulobacter sp.]
MLLDAIPAVETPSSPALSSPSTAREAVDRYGQPTLRQPLADGGERLRWIRLRETILASMDVRTVEVDAAGRVVRASQRTVAMKDPAAY